MFCRKCGADILDDSQFCPKCGADVMVPPVANTPPPGEATAVTTPLQMASAGTAPSSDVLGPAHLTPDRGVPTQNSRKVLFAIGLVALAMWALYDLWQQGFFYTAFDIRLWLLGIPLYVLHRSSVVRSNQLLSMERAEAVPAHKPAKAPASRWARLAIFLCVALVSAVFVAVVLVKGSPTFVESQTEKLTKVSLQLGLAVWAVSETFAARWLTIRRTWIAAIALYTVAFILMAVLLSKPLATKMAEFNEEQARLDRRFAQTATGKAFLQPQSFASPQVAAASLVEFQQYADATEELNKQEEALLLQRNDPALRDRWAAYFGATRAAASAAEELYRFAAEPSRQVHVENGAVGIADPKGYNERIDATNTAMEKLRSATAALGESVPTTR